MDHDKAEGFVVNPGAIDYYVGQIVNPALDNFEHIASKLSATTSPSSAMLGHEKLAGSTEFTGTCRRMLDRLFEAHHMLTERQNALVQVVTRFRDNLQAASASYVHNEANQAQSFGNLSRRLEIERSFIPMAPPDRQPDPGHPAAAGLDGEFGHEGEIAAWIEWLLHPEQHDYDRMIVRQDGTKFEHTSNLPVPTRAGAPQHFPYESVIRDCFVEQFFDPALALSGQQFDDDSDLSKVYEALDDAFWKNDDDIGTLTGGFNDLRQVCQASVIEGAGAYLGRIQGFMGNFVEIAKQLAAISIAYAGIIRAARENLNEAMGQLVDAFHKRFYAREDPSEEVLVAALGLISGAALSYVTGGTAGAAWAAGMDKRHWGRQWSTRVVTTMSVGQRGERSLTPILRRR